MSAPVSRQNPFGPELSYDHTQTKPLSFQELVLLRSVVFIASCRRAGPHRINLPIESLNNNQSKLSYEAPIKSDLQKTRVPVRCMQRTGTVSTRAHAQSQQ